MASPFIDIMMLRQASRTSQTDFCRTGSGTSTTALAKPWSPMQASRRFKSLRSAARSSPANSTRRRQFGRPRVMSARVVRNSGMSAPSTRTLLSTSSTATGPRSTSAFVVSMAERKDGKWQTPMTRWAGRRESCNVTLVVAASVPSEPTRRWARFGRGAIRASRL